MTVLCLNKVTYLPSGVTNIKKRIPYEGIRTICEISILKQMIIVKTDKKNHAIGQCCQCRDFRDNHLLQMEVVGK